MIELFTRLTWNDNEWIVPCGHPWKKSDQGKGNIPYENQYGFGHEEWIFNPRYNIDGFQYGYIRGLRRLRAKTAFVDKVHLYSVRKTDNSKIVYYLGSLENVELLVEGWEKNLKNIMPVFNSYNQYVKKELLQVNCDIRGLLTNDPFVPVVRFQNENLHLLDEPLIVEDFPLQTYKRFQPYVITPQISKLFNGLQIEKKAELFEFIPGKAKQTDRFNRYNNAENKSVIKLHCEIIDALQSYLAPDFSTEKKNISIEKTRFAGNIADIVTETGRNNIIIYEVKTSLNTRKNIREALAQLLDYATHAGKAQVNKLVIVSPSKVTIEDSAFLKMLNQRINYTIDYLFYNKSEGQRFKYYE